MKKWTLSIFVIMTMILFSSFQVNPSDLFEKMFEKNRQIKTLKISVNIKERIGDKTVDKYNGFTINVNPYKVYFTEEKYGIDIEGIYIQGKNNNLAKIATKGFPWLNMDLDPYGSKMRKETHHIIFDAGFNYFIALLENLKKKNGDKFQSMLVNQGLFKRGTQYFYKLEMNNAGFHYVDYIVKKGETLPSIAKKLHVNDYMLLEKNPSINDYNDVKEGQRITVPTDYAKKMIFHLDKDLLLPIYVELYDDLGFYASYSFNNIVVNPQLDDLIFDAKNPNYHFE